jgi:putative hydrolase of the HAD superfamily
MLLDLDNTLVDRDAAFAEAAAAFLAARKLPATDLPWLMAVDNSGYTPRDEVAAAMAGRYGNADDIRVLLDHGAADHVVLEPATRQALQAARARGWVAVIVTNGRTAQQEVKIRRTGLDRLVRGWVVSEALGHRKPEPEIFRSAAEVGGLPLRDAWMIGDSPHADIGGAVAAGLRSVWVSNNQTWSVAGYAPTEIAVDGAAAIRRVLGERFERSNIDHAPGR